MKLLASRISHLLPPDTVQYVGDFCDGSGMARFPRDVLFPMLRALQADDYAEARQLTLIT